MKLSHMSLRGEESLVRNADFESFGMVTDGGARLCVPANTAALVDQAAGNDDVGAIVCLPELVSKVPSGLGVISAPSPLDVVFRNHIARFERGECWPGEPTRIAPSATIHPGAHVAANDVVIGERTVVSAGVVIEPNSTIGDDCAIGPGVVIGGNGFEVREIDGRRRTIPHGGGVIIGDRVELQANTSVTRSLFSGATMIGDESATDNLVHVAHNVRIGKRCRLAAAAMIAGSTVLADNVWVGPNATVSNGLTIGEGAQISLGAVVIGNVPAGEKVTGHFAIEHRSFMRFFRFMRNPKA